MAEALLFVFGGHIHDFSLTNELSQYKGFLQLYSNRHLPSTTVSFEGRPTLHIPPSCHSYLPGPGLSPLMKIKEANVTVMVNDMKGAIHFYVDVLGLELKANYGDHYAQVASPGVMIGLHPATKEG